MKLCIFFCWLCLASIASATNYGSFKQIADIDFESNAVVDLLGNTNPASFNGAVIVEDQQRGGKVLQFNAQSKGGLQIENCFLSDTITFSFWGKRQDTDPSTAWRMFLALYAPDGSNVYLTPRTTWGEECFLIAENKPYGTYKSAKGKSITPNEWYHYVIVFSGNDLKYYVNSELQATITLMETFPDFKFNQCYFGCNPSLNYPMSGSIDDLKIYHTALVSNQIGALYKDEQLPPAQEEDAVVAKFTFDPGWVDDLGDNAPEMHHWNVVQDPIRGTVAELKSDSYLTISMNEWRSEDFTVNFLYAKETFQKDDDNRILMLLSGRIAGDYTKLYTTYSEDTGLALHLDVMENGILRSSGKIVPVLSDSRWNCITFTQMFSKAGTPYYKLYINGELGKQVAGYKPVNELTTMTWGDAHQALNGRVDEITIFSRNLALADIKNMEASLCTSVRFIIQADKQYQTICNFGSSDGWSTQPIGTYFANEKKERLAELLFSCEDDIDGTPKGIGLSAWRFNIGAGTAEQGTASRISNETRRTECFLNSDGKTYDWNRQAGQRWFLEKAAKEYKVKDIIGWQNSPPVYFTKRGLGFREFGDAKSTILKKEHYDDFGRFLADVVNHFKQEGILFSYVSPLNEPQWDWAATSVGGIQQQEGTPWTNQEISEVVKAIDKEFVDNHVNARLLVGEAGSINYLLKGSSGFAANQLTELWDKNSSLSIGSLPSLSNHVSSHSYWTDATAADIVSKRQSLKEDIASVNHGLDYWQTEYSLMGTGYQWGHKFGTLSSIECAVSMARIIYSDLAEADCSGWQWWTTFEDDALAGAEDRYALIRYVLNKDKSDGVFRATKLLYAMGNFSRFVRPGMKRIAIERTDGLTSQQCLTQQMATAFIDDKDKKIVLVVINAADTPRMVSLTIDGLEEGYGVEQFTPYLTDKENNLQCLPAVNSNSNYTMPAKSIVTLVGTANNVGSGLPQPASAALSVSPNPSSDYFQITSEKMIDCVWLTNLSGHILKKVDGGKQNKVQLSVQELEKGVYVLVVHAEGQSQSAKVIIK